jgi:hypothetical protein
MGKTWIAVLVSMLAGAIGCSASSTPVDAAAASDAFSATDASATNDAYVSDATMPNDAYASDASTPNDASANDAATNDAAAHDANVNCAVIGCGAPPICGTACDAPCGCCPCADGTEMGSYVCQGGCWAPRGTGTDGSACSMTSDCGSGLSCCYPCGIPGCTNQCTPTCTPGSPGCSGGCVLHA